MERSVKLSDRLSSIKETVLPCNVLADVGCDHGFVSIALALSDTAGRVLAMDVNKGPLTQAEHNIKEYGLGDRIETRLSDGLHNASVEDGIDAVIIAGMGGALMTGILTEGLDIVSGVKQLVLQPQSEMFLVREWIRNNGFHIYREKFLEDMGKYYTVMDVRPGETVVTEPELADLYDSYSEYLIKEKNLLYREYIEKSIEVNKGYLAGIASEKQGSLAEKLKDLEKVSTLMKK